MQSLKSPYTLYNQQSVGSTLHNNLLFITYATLKVDNANYFHVFRLSFAPLNLANIIYFLRLLPGRNLRCW